MGQWMRLRLQKPERPLIRSDVRRVADRAMGRISPDFKETGESEIEDG